MDNLHNRSITMSSIGPMTEDPIKNNLVTSFRLAAAVANELAPIICKDANTRCCSSISMTLSGSNVCVLFFQSDETQEIAATLYNTAEITATLAAQALRGSDKAQQPPFFKGRFANHLSSTK